MRQKWTDYRVFWREFRQTRRDVGAVLPSGRALSRALVRYVAEAEGVGQGDGVRAGERRILEVGPGTGAVTEEILRALRPSDRLVLVERNEQFVARLRARLADEALACKAASRITLLHSDIEELDEGAPFDVIVSGLPLNNFAPELVERILAKLRRLLAPDGTLSFFEYVGVRRAKSLVSSAVERERLRGVGGVLGRVLRGAEVRRDLVIANVPPAWVHHVRFSAGSRERGAEDVDGCRVSGVGYRV